MNRPGIPQCKKCGRSLLPPARKESSSLLSNIFSFSSPRASAVTGPSPPIAEPPSIWTPEENLEQSSTDLEPIPTAASDSGEPAGGPMVKAAGMPPIEPETEAIGGDATPKIVPPRAMPGGPAASPLWQEELSGRVEKFRRRRARLRNEFDPSSSLDLAFDFGNEDEAQTLDAPFDPALSGPAQLDQELGQESANWAESEAALDSQSLSPPEGGIHVLSGAAVVAGELPVAGGDDAAKPLEIFLESPGAARQAASPLLGAAAEPRTILAQRFMAGVVDAAILLAGAGVFAGIFWGVCLRDTNMAARPVDLIALGFVGASILMLYFGMAVAMTASTPGLDWMGLEVRNLEGDLPTARESFWRAFGYLVSASALFMGFVWALVDVDGFTWHDLMSGTYVAKKE